MKDYYVSLKVDAKATIKVQASSVEDAARKAVVDFEGFDVGDLEIVGVDVISTED